MEAQPVSNFIAMGYLNRVAIGNSCTVQRAQKQKPTHFPFRLPYRYRACRWRCRVEQARRLEQRHPRQHEDPRGGKPEFPAPAWRSALLRE